MMRLMLPVTFFLIVLSCVVFPQDLMSKKEKIPNTSEDLIKARLNEGRELLPSENDQMKFIENQVLGSGYIIDEYIIQQWNTTTTMWDNYIKFDPEYNSSDKLIDSLILLWNGSSWENYIRRVYTYTGTNLEATNTSQSWSGVDWINSSRKSTSYDAGNRPTELLYETWTGASWENDYRYQSQYNPHGLIASYTYQYWSGGVWNNNYKYTYTYNSSDLLTDQLYQYWSGGVWANSNKITRTYDGMGNVLTEISYNWSGGAWQNNSQKINTYANGNMTEYLYQIWDPINGWVNYYHYLYQYDSNNNPKEQLIQNWDAVYNQWVNSAKYTYTYNSQNSVLTQLIENWNTGTGWQNYYNAVYTYDAHNNLSDLTLQNWDSGSSVWVNYLRETAFIWKMITEFGDEDLIVNNFKLYDNYPNPFNPSTKIKFSVPSISNVTIKVYDVMGKEIKSLVNQTLQQGVHEIEFSGNGYASGVYFYTIEAQSLDGKKSFVETRKMMLLK